LASIFLFFSRSVRDLWYFFNDFFFFYNIAIIVYLFNVEILVEATLPIVASDADITLNWDVSFLESAGGVKFAIYLVFSFVRPDAALNFIFLVRYEDDIFKVSLSFRESCEHLSAEVVVI